MSHDQSTIEVRTSCPPWWLDAVLAAVLVGLMAGVVALFAWSAPAASNGRGALPFGIPVLPARFGSLVAIAAAGVVLMLVVPRWFRDVRSGDERVRIALRFGASLIDIEALPEPPEVARVELAEFDALLRVARTTSSPVLHRPGPPDHYAVVHEGTLYLYSIGSATERLEPSELSGSVVPLHHQELDAVGRGQR